jgi:hypothetical protein
MRREHKRCSTAIFKHAITKRFHNLAKNPPHTLEPSEDDSPIIFVHAYTEVFALPGEDSTSCFKTSNDALWAIFDCDYTE